MTQYNWRSLEAVSNTAADRNRFHVNFADFTKAISINSYKKATANVCSDVIKSSEHWYDELKAFETYIVEQDTNVQMSKIKERWDQLGLFEKSDFMCRVKAEGDFKD